MRGIILYGPPAAGKDTVTTELHRISNEYALFRRLKAGGGRTTGYRITTEQKLGKLRMENEIVWENRRYDAIYAIDRSSLLNYLTHQIPVVHLGQIAAIDAVNEAIPDVRWLVVYIWCPRDVAARRIAARDTSDTEARLQAWDETVPASYAHIRINTADTPARDAAQEI